MALSSVGGGFQVGDGNLNEVQFKAQAAPVAKAAAAVLTPAELGVGLLTYNGAAVNLTLPTGALMDAQFTNAKVDTAFQFAIVNTGAAIATVVAGTGFTIVGVAAIAATSSAICVVRKSGVATWVLYRVGT